MVKVGRFGWMAVVVGLGIVLTLGSCATAGERGDRDFRVITAEELENAQASDLFEAIQRIRPRWLQTRGDRSFGALGTGILVYYNGSRMGTPEEALRNMPIEGIHHIRRADSSEAARLPGAGAGMHVESAILIFTRPEG